MVKSCCAPNCQNRKYKGCKIPFYRFPVDKERRAAWIAFLNRKNLPNLDFAFICGEHFITGKFMGLCVFRAGNLSKNTSFINFMLHVVQSSYKYLR